MIHRIKRMFGQTVHSFEWHPTKNPSMAIKSHTGKREPLTNFRHGWFQAPERGYRIAAMANLSFFDYKDPKQLLHMGLLGRDGGYSVEGVPNNGYEVWLGNDNTLNIKQLNMVGVKGIGDAWKWAVSLAYPLVLDGKKNLDPNVKGFSRAKTERTAYGQKADKTLIMMVSTDLDDDQTAEVMLSLGCINAVSGDGGGSTQLMVEGEYIMKGRDVGTVMAVFAKEGETVQVIDETKQPLPSQFEGYRVTSPYGWRTLNGRREFHTGIDIVKNHKDPIYAFTDGEVIYAGEGMTGTGFGGYGNVVAIKDSNNCLQLYAHLDSVVVKKGAMVDKGQFIGRQGTTGRSTGSHLHFEVRKVSESHIPYGWRVDRENNCHEPVEYLNTYNENHTPKPPTPERKPTDFITWGEFEQYMKEKGLI